MQTYLVTLTGKTPLLMHQDNIDWSDFMDEWKDDPANKKGSKAGDDRCPAWRWIGSCYHDGAHLTIPQENIMRCLMEGGALVPVPGKSRKTFKAQTQSGMMSVEPHWKFDTESGPVKWSDIEKLKDVGSFKVHREAVKDLGFELRVKRARVGQSKHIRVRPEFAAGWTATGSLAVWDEQITGQALSQIFAYAGQYRGLGDWRPGAPSTPGAHGMFEAKIKAA